MRDRDTIFEKLWEKSGGRCAVCGKELRKGEAEISHIFPRKYGGKDNIENLVLMCMRCNRYQADRPFLDESVCEKAIYNALSLNSKISDICPGGRAVTADGKTFLFDITFSRAVHEKKEKYAVEIKCVEAVTEEKMEGLIQRLTYYQECFPDMHFILALPTFVTEEYRRWVEEAGFDLWDMKTIFGESELRFAAEDRYDSLIRRLENCRPGSGEWQVYQKLMGEILSAVFCPPISGISEQNADARNINCRDFVMPNYCESGPWKWMKDDYAADFIVADAKNSSEKIGKEDILQVANYLKKKGVGLFGLILSRAGGNANAEAYQQEIWRDSDKMIVILNDEDVKQMLLMRKAGDDPCWILLEKIKEFRLRI